jgi:hypothetical protein
MPSFNRGKLLELRDAIELLLEQGNHDACLDFDTIGKLSDMDRFVRAWLEDDSALSEDERIVILAKMTETLKPRILMQEGPKVILH